MSEECVLDFKAFAKGGKGGMQQLEKVWKNIMKEHAIDTEQFPALLNRAGMCLNVSGRITPLEEECDE